MWTTDCLLSARLARADTIPIVRGTAGKVYPVWSDFAKWPASTPERGKRKIADPKNRKGIYVSVDPLGFLLSGRDERI